MKKRDHPWLMLCILVAVISIAALGARSARRHAHARRRYFAVAAAIPPGTSREEVERYLTRQSLDFGREWGPGSVAMDDLVRLSGRYNFLSSLWCARQSPAVLIRFAESQSGRRRRIQPGKQKPVNSVYPASDAFDDEVTGFEYELICNDDI